MLLQQCILVSLLATICLAQGPRSYPFQDPNTAASVGSDGSDRSYATATGQKVRVFDNVVSKKRLEILHVSSLQLQTSSKSWQFQHEDGVAGSSREQGRGSTGATGNTPWSTRLDAVWFGKSNFGQSIAGALESSWGAALKPYDVRMLALRRGDNTLVSDGVPKELNEVWSVVYFTRTKWKGDYYGETIFYDEEDEIVAACQPKFGRLVAWDASVSYLMRPPSMSFQMAQYLLSVRWTTNDTLIEKAERERKDYDAETDRGVEDGLFSTGDRSVPEDLDVRKYETQHVVTRTTGKNVYVFDNLLNRSDVDALRKYAKRYGHFTFGDYSVGDEGSDNVQWIGKYSIDQFVRSKYWKIIQKVVEYTAGGSDWYPYDIACNVVRSSDHTRIHGDVRNDEDDEWTLLIYLSPEWDASSYGETAWFTGREGDGMTHDVDIETEVLPVYGRVAIFEGLIPHAARPPSITYHGPRYSFAVKMAANRWLSSRNLMQEEFHEKMDVFSYMAQVSPAYGKFVSLGSDEAGDDFNGKFAKRYWKAFVAQDEKRRADLLDEVFTATRGDGAKLNALLDFLVALIKKKLAAIKEYGLSLI